jgi:hypothetical protein
LETTAQPGHDPDLLDELAIAAPVMADAPDRIKTALLGAGRVSPATTARWMSVADRL